MLILFFILTILIIFCWNIKLNYPEYQKIIWLALGILLILISGFRENVGIDFEMYKFFYEEPDSRANETIEPLWRFVNRFLYNIGFNYHIFFLYSSAIIVGVTLYFYHKDSKFEYAALLLFVTMGFYFESMNLVRQYCAISLMFLSFKYFVDKNYKLLGVISFLAVCCHLSALFAIVIVILSKIRLSKKLMIITIVASLLFGDILMSHIVSFVMEAIVGLRYSYSPDDFSTGVSSGTLKYVYNLLVIGIILTISRKGLEKKYMWPMLTVVVAGLCIYNIFYLFMVARRLSLYGLCFLPVLIPKAIQYINLDIKSKYLTYGMICAVFSAFTINTYIGKAYNFQIF